MVDESDYFFLGNSFSFNLLRAGATKAIVNPFLFSPKTTGRLSNYTFQKQLEKSFDSNNETLSLVKQSVCFSVPLYLNNVVKELR